MAANAGGTLDGVLDLLIRDARIRTVDPARPTATAVGIWNGAIAGLDEDVLRLPARSTVSVDGAVIVPGFHDAHCHTTSYGLGPVLLDLTGVEGPAATLEAVAAYAAGLGESDWVIASGRRACRGDDPGEDQGFFAPLVVPAGAATVAGCHLRP